MGEIADAMINGAMCGNCGECLGDEVGYPRDCEECSTVEVEPIKVKVKCPVCGKKVSESGLVQHMEAKHKESEIEVSND